MMRTLATISELKSDPIEVIERGEGATVVILDHNEPVFYIVPAAAYEALLNKLDDFELSRIVESRLNQTEIEPRG